MRTPEQFEPKQQPEAQTPKGRMNRPGLPAPRPGELQPIAGTPNYPIVAFVDQMPNTPTTAKKMAPCLSEPKISEGENEPGLLQFTGTSHIAVELGRLGESVWDMAGTVQVPLDYHHSIPRPGYVLEHRQLQGTAEHLQFTAYYDRDSGARISFLEQRITFYCYTLLSMIDQCNIPNSETESQKLRDRIDLLYHRLGGLIEAEQILTSNQHNKDVIAFETPLWLIKVLKQFPPDQFPWPLKLDRWNNASESQ